VVNAKSGEVLMTDGPFPEGKEHIGGFWVIQAKDLDEALAWASKATVACQGPVEVRPSTTSRGPDAFGGDRRPGDRTCIPGGIWPRRRGAHPGCRRHRHRRGGGPGRVHRCGAAVARHRTASEPGRLDHHDREKSRDRPPPARGLAPEPPRPGRAAARGPRAGR
jgi:hypothetical protein